VAVALAGLLAPAASRADDTPQFPLRVGGSIPFAYGFTDDERTSGVWWGLRLTLTAYRGPTHQGLGLGLWGDFMATVETRSWFGVGGLARLPLATSDMFAACLTPYAGVRRGTTRFEPDFVVAGLALEGGVSGYAFDWAPLSLRVEGMFDQDGLAGVMLMTDLSLLVVGSLGSGAYLH
jgi:hypothetical protein